MTNDTELKLRLVESMGKTEAQLEILTEMTHEIKSEQKEIREHNDKVVHELQEHFDSKIAKCHEDVMGVVNKTHLNETEVRVAITKAINASEKRMLMRFAFIGAAIVFLYEYAEPVINFINMLRGK